MIKKFLLTFFIFFPFLGFGAISLIDKVEPKNNSFTGLVDAKQIIGGTENKLSNSAYDAVGNILASIGNGNSGDYLSSTGSGAVEWIAPEDYSDANTLGGQPGSYYLNASNITTGTLAAERFNSLADLAGEANPASGQILQFNGTQFISADLPAPTTSASDLTEGVLADSRLNSTVTFDSEWNTLAKIEAIIGTDIVTASELSQNPPAIGTGVPEDGKFTNLTATNSFTCTGQVAEFKGNLDYPIDVKFYAWDEGEIGGISYLSMAWNAEDEKWYFYDGSGASAITSLYVSGMDIATMTGFNGNHYSIGGTEVINAGRNLLNVSIPASLINSGTLSYSIFPSTIKGFEVKATSAHWIYFAAVTASYDSSQSGMWKYASTNPVVLTIVASGKNCYFPLTFTAGTILTKLRVKIAGSCPDDGVAIRLLKRQENAAVFGWTVIGSQQTYTTDDLAVFTYDFPNEVVTEGYSYTIEVRSVVEEDGVNLYSVGIETSTRFL